MTVVMISGASAGVGRATTRRFAAPGVKLGRRAQPVPPVYQPEVIADAIHHAAHHPRREYWLGLSAVKAILAAKLVPGVADRMLARQGYDGQTTGKPAEDRPDNPFEPVPGPYGAHGRFDDIASARSPAIWTSKHRNALLALAAAVAAGAVFGILTRRVPRTR